MKLAVVGTLAYATVAAAQGPSASLSISDVRAGVDAYWGSIQTISASYHSSTPGPVTDSAVRDHRAAVTLKGDKVYFDYTYGGAPSFEGRVFNRVLAFDGNESVEQDTTNGGAFVRPGRYARVNPHEAPGFFDLCMLTSASGTFGEEFPDACITALFNKPELRLRPELEEVDGHWCHVVDLPGEGGRLWVSAWIDADRGFLPLRHVLWQASGAPMLDFRVDDAIQLPTGHWVPVRGRKAVGVLPDLPQVCSPVTIVTQVEQDTAGRYQVAINQPVEDSLFALRHRVPPGFRVVDLQTHQSWIARGNDYERSGRAIQTTIANLDLRLRRHGVPLQTTQRDLTPRQGRVAAAHAASGLVGALFTSILGLGFVRWWRGGTR